MFSKILGNFTNSLSSIDELTLNLLKLKILGDSNLSDYHLMLSSLYGVYLIYGVCGVLFLFNSPDEGVFSGHLWSKIVANSLIFMENMHSYYLSNRWSYKLLCSSGSLALFSLLISAYFFVSTKRPRGTNQFYDKVNNVAKLEAFIVFYAGLLMFAFPNFSMVKLF